MRETSTHQDCSAQRILFGVVIIAGEKSNERAEHNKWRRKYCDAKDEGRRMHLGKLQLVSSTFADDQMLLLRLHLLFDNNNCAISKPWTDARAAFIASIAYLFPSSGCAAAVVVMHSK